MPRERGDECVTKRKMLKVVIPVVIGIGAVLVCLFTQNNHTGNEFLVSDEYSISQTQISENAVDTDGIEDGVEVDEIEPTEDFDNDSEKSSETIGGLDVVNAYINEQLHLINVLSDGSEVDAGVIKVESGDPAAESFIVTFLNYDGAILKKQVVGSGGSAIPPADPIREGFIFLGWKGAYENITTDSTAIAMFHTEWTEPDTYVVRFLDFDGTIIDEQVVSVGKTASIPELPEREGYEFSGWDTRLSPVFSDQTYTAQYTEYTENEDAVIINVGNAKTLIGDTVQLSVSLKNNPGLLGMELSLAYDDSSMTLINAVNGSATADMNLSKPGKLLNGCTFVWDNTESVNSDGEFLVLTFRILDSAKPGIYPIEIICGNTPLVDDNLDTLTPVVNRGIITVS